MSFHNVSLEIQGTLSSSLQCFLHLCLCLFSILSLLLVVPLFSMSIWLLCSCCIVLGCRDPGVIIVLPFMVTLSIISSSSLNIKYSHISCFSSFLCARYPCIIYVFRSCRCMPLFMAVWMSFVGMHVDTVTSLE